MQTLAQITFQRSFVLRGPSFELVRWTSLPLKGLRLRLEVEADAAGVRVMGHSPTLATADAAALCDVIAEATVVHEMMRDGFTWAQVKSVLETHQREQ